MLSVGALGYLWRESHRRLDAHLDSVINDVWASLLMEAADAPHSSVRFIASEVVAEWPRNSGSFVITDSGGRLLAATDSTAASASTKAWTGDSVRHFYVEAKKQRRYRNALIQYRIAVNDSARRSRTTAFHVAAFASTDGISEDTELLVAAVSIAAPLILLLSVVGGYMMAGRGLRPVTELTNAIAKVDPQQLTRRLPVKESQDELGKLAAEFNALFSRLHREQVRNRKFLREAAHQIRTPLTLVLGEAALELQTPDDSVERMRASFGRINSAAERMRRRVDELFLLAEAQTGEEVVLKEIVDFDNLVFEVVDLMRPRATALGRGLAIGVAEHASVRGNAELLHEALLEMLENAVRHGNSAGSVTVSSRTQNNHAILEVVSAGAPFSLPPKSDEPGPEGLGLPIVRWVAEVHGGELSLQHSFGWNTLMLAIPVARETQ